MKLTVRREWLKPGFLPKSFDESPFFEMEGPALPFPDVAMVNEPVDPLEMTLKEFGGELARALDGLLEPVAGHIHCMLSGGYDSRAIAALLERQGKDVRYITDGTQEPACSRTLDYLGIPERRVWRLPDQELADPYGILQAKVAGWAPIYTAMNFLPTNPKATLVTGLGGGEWFSYPAAGWHDGKPRRWPHTSIVNMWLDCWPQYTLIHKAWSSGYADSLHPFCTAEYAQVAKYARREWLHENTSRPALDAVRLALLDAIDPVLSTLGWEPHRYDFQLTADEEHELDSRAYKTWLWDSFAGPWGRPSALVRDPHAATMAGFAQWCDSLILAGYELELER